MIYKWFVFKNVVADKLWLTCSVSIAAQVITFPLSAYYFHQFPVYFLVSNLLIIIPVCVIMYSGLALLIVPQTTYLSKALGFVLEKSILTMNKVLNVIEHSPYASINKIWMSTIEYPLLYVIIILIFYYLYNKKKWMITACLCCILVLSFSIGIKKIKADQLRSITFLNMRKHSGIVFKSGQKGIVITDLPEGDRNFQYSIKPCLDSSRITDYRVYAPGAAIQTPYLLKQSGLVWFENKKLLLLNDPGQFQSIPQQLALDYLYVSDNATVSNMLNRNYTVIIDGSNSSQYTHKVRQAAGTFRSNIYILKRNKSLMMLSKPYNN